MHRLTDIRHKSLTKEWKYISDLQNIADMCTRTSLFSALHPLSNWVKGLEIMYELENDNYPIEIDDQVINFVQAKSNQWDH